MREPYGKSVHLCKHSYAGMDEVEEWLEQVLDEYPHDAGADNGFAFLWADADKHLERALNMIVAAVAAEPENRAYRDRMGGSTIDSDTLRRQSWKWGRRSDESHSEGTVLDNLGDAYRIVDQTDKAHAARL